MSIVHKITLLAAAAVQVFLDDRLDWWASIIRFYLKIFRYMIITRGIGDTAMATSWGYIGGVISGFITLARTRPVIENLLDINLASVP